MRTSRAGSRAGASSRRRARSRGFDHPSRRGDANVRAEPLAVFLQCGVRGLANRLADGLGVFGPFGGEPCRRVRGAVSPVSRRRCFRRRVQRAPTWRLAATSAVGRPASRLASARSREWAEQALTGWPSGVTVPRDHPIHQRGAIPSRKLLDSAPRRMSPQCAKRDPPPPNFLLYAR